VPIRRSRRRMHAREVMFLMTSAALNRIYSSPVGSSSDLHCVLMAVISLTRKISGGVAIHASGMTQDRNDGLKSSAGTIGCRFELRSGIKCHQEGSQHV
jgi:hypothetical protein